MMRNAGKRGAGAGWIYPLLFALPFAAAVLFATVKWGKTIKDMIHVLIKLAVIS